MSEIRGAKFTNLAASALIKTGPGKVFGFVVNSHTSGALKLWNALTATNPTMINTFTFPSGSGVYKFPEPIEFTTGLYATITNTADITILYK